MSCAMPHVAEEPFFLAPHVYPCVCGQHVVLMDLKRDKYLAVMPADRLLGWVRGWPVGARQRSSAARADGPRDGLVSQLLADGMLVDDPAMGKPAVTVTIARPLRTLLQFDFDVRPPVSVGQLGVFARSWAQARLSLKLRPIGSVVAAVGARKARCAARGLGSAEPARLAALVSAFVHLRPLFYTVRAACLLDSLTLVHFLSAYGICPDWVFGVKTVPFDAHCWVQQGDVVLNDLPDRVRQYAPILIV